MTYGTTYDNITPPTARKFKCENNNCDGSFWSVFPDSFNREPNSEIVGSLPKLETTAQCPECKIVNRVYWYAQKPI